MAQPVRAFELTKEHTEFFEAKVRPLLVKHCYECHSTETEKVKGGLLLDSRDGWMAGGDSGEALEPGKPGSSLIMETVRYDNPDLQMPPKYRLSETEMDVLEDWITMGAPDPRTGTAVARSAGIDWEKGRQHWAFQPVLDPPVPSVKEPEWVRDELDRFILAGIERAGLKPVADADRFALIRRLTLDLTGLPPGVDEVGAFVRDPGSDDEAIAKVVDRLLASEAFGERWGRHWLDVARYADSVGRTRNVPFPYAWRYRNYVINSLNSDKPYDQFLVEQVAGDLLKARDAGDREENLIATGLLALGSMDLNERDREQFQLDRIDDQMDTLGRAVMGMTLGCARCHDHKFDPITQEDYYAMAGIFASTATMSGQSSRQGNNQNYHRSSLLVSLESTGTGKPTLPGNGVGKENAEVAKLRSRAQEIFKKGKGKAGPKQKAALLQEFARIRERLTELGAADDLPLPGRKGTAKGKEEEERMDPSAPLAMAAVEGQITDLALRVRGEPDIKGDVVPRAFPAILRNDSVPALTADGSGRRELALWLTSPEHPLTARVMVNRIWTHLLGRGLVETVDNFGVSGAAPTHPDLLDHLAIRFVSEGWSVKSLIRSLVLSRTYRLGAAYPAANVAADEANSLYWRANLRRLEAEAIRDSLLAAGGILNRERPAGAPFDAGVSADLSKSKGKRGGGSGDRISDPVRSVYLPVFRSRLPGMFTVFDFAEPDQVNGRRDVTTVAPQALFFLNNPFTVDIARRAAERILAQDLPGEEDRIRFAYAYALCRYPTAREAKRALEFLQSDEDRETAWAALTQALYSSAEFRYLP